MLQGTRCAVGLLATTQTWDGDGSAWDEQVQGGGVSKWTMRYETLGVPLRYSWTAQELPSIKHELIHWETTSGLDNKGRVEFSKVAGASGEEEIGVKMTIVYKLPRLVAMLTRDKSDGEEGAVRKTVQRIIQVTQHPPCPSTPSPMPVPRRV